MGTVSIYIDGEETASVLPRPEKPAMIWMIGPVIGKHPLMGSVLKVDLEKAPGSARDLGFPDQYVKLWYPDDGYNELVWEIRSAGLFEKHDFIQIKLPKHADDAFAHPHDADSSAAKLVSAVHSQLGDFKGTVRLWIRAENKWFIEALRREIAKRA